MARSKTRVAAAIVGGALALGGITAGATVAAADPTESPSATPSAGPPTPNVPATPGSGPSDGQVRHPEVGGLWAAGLAEKLGLDEDKVREALESVHREMRADREDLSDPPSRDERAAERAKRLAEKLGVDQSDVETAIAELQDAHKVVAFTSLKERLAEAVEEGTLTQAEADAVVKATEAGVIPAIRGPR